MTTKKTTKKAASKKPTVPRKNPLRRPGNHRPVLRGEISSATIWVRMPQKNKDFLEKKCKELDLKMSNMVLTIVNNHFRYKADKDK